MTRRFAEGTTVSPANSRAEIEKLVTRYGATEFSSGWSGSQAAVMFQAHQRRVRFTVTVPTAADLKKDPKHKWTADAKLAVLAEAETRRRWRCLCLAIKAKLEVVASGIETFEEAFLANIVTDDGATVYERIAAGNLKLLEPVR